MKTTKNISLGGYAFIVEEDAYKKLESYTNAIRLGFANEVGGEEIQYDIELRIAEIFKEKLEGREVLNIGDVEDMIRIMGEPSIYTSESNSINSNDEESQIEKRFFRDPDKRVFGGVSAGIAAYFGIEPVWVRLAFLIALFGYGTGIGLYLILWVAIPEAKTTSDKLAMRGKAPNLLNITESIKNNKNLVKTGNNILGILTETLHKVVDLTVKIVLVIGKIFLIAMVIFFSMFLFAMVILLLNKDNFSAGPLTSWDQIKTFVFNDPSMANIGYIALLLIFLIPLLYLVYRTVLYFLKQKQVNKYISVTALLSWLLSLTIASYIGINLGLQYKQSGQTIQTFTYPSDTSTIFYIHSNQTDSVLEHVLEDGSLRIKNINVDIIKGSSDSLIAVKVIRKQKGPSKPIATEGAKLIQFATNYEDGRLYIPNFLTIPPKQKLRAQEVEIEITIPYGQSISLHPSIRKMINDIELDGKVYERDIYGYTLKMTPYGLSCSDCPEELFKKVRKDSINNSVDSIMDRVNAELEAANAEINAEIKSNNDAVKIQINTK